MRRFEAHEHFQEVQGGRESVGMSAPASYFRCLRRRCASSIFRNYFETRFHSGDDGDETWRARDLAFSRKKSTFCFHARDK